MSTFTINGVELYYELVGDPTAKEAIVFLNGVMAQYQQLGIPNRTFQENRISFITA